MSSKRVEIPLSKGFKLVAESSCDPNYPRELYIGIEAPDGVWVQDLAVVMNEYRYKQDSQIDYLDDVFKVLVYVDNENDDYTDEFRINLRDDIKDE